MIDKQQLLCETIVLLSADLYQEVYDISEGWGPACETIVSYAKQFENELDWQEDDERDYLEELKIFETRMRDELQIS